MEDGGFPWVPNLEPGSGVCGETPAAAGPPAQILTRPPMLSPGEGVQAAWAGASGLHLGLDWRVPASLLAPLSPPKTALIKIKFSFLHHPCPWVLDPRLSAGVKLADGVCQDR